MEGAPNQEEIKRRERMYKEFYHRKYGKPAMAPATSSPPPKKKLSEEEQLKDQAAGWFGNKEVRRE